MLVHFNGMDRRLDLIGDFEGSWYHYQDRLWMFKFPTLLAESIYTVQQLRSIQYTCWKSFSNCPFYIDSCCFKKNGTSLFRADNLLRQLFLRLGFHLLSLCLNNSVQYSVRIAEYSIQRIRTNAVHIDVVQRLIERENSKKFGNWINDYKHLAKTIITLVQLTTEISPYIEHETELMYKIHNPHHFLDNKTSWLSISKESREQLNMKKPCQIPIWLTAKKRTRSTAINSCKVIGYFQNSTCIFLKNWKCLTYAKGQRL